MIPRIHLRQVIAILLWVFPCIGQYGMARAAGLVINESLANEPGSVTSLEWVELLNWPDTGHGAVSLIGYRLVDGRDTTRFDTNLTIAPGGFVIIARRPMGAESFESHWGDNSGVWGDVPSESIAVVSAKISLRNTNDTVTLISPGGDTSRMTWSHDAGDRISIERIRPNQDDGPENFALCSDPAGSTPGRTNSRFPIREDLSLDSVQLIPIEPRWCDTIRVVAHFTNVGLGSIGTSRVDVYDDALPSQTGDSLVAIATTALPMIEELASVSAILEWPNPPPGPHSVIARVVTDANPLNNTAASSTVVRFCQPLVIVSEFLANPTVGGPDEWIEISNQAGFPINMTGVRIGDSSGTSPLPDSIGLMWPGEFWILAENEAAFRGHFPDFTERLVPIPSWHELNNTGDRIRLIGASGEIIDSLSFRNTSEDDRSIERAELSPVFATSKYWKSSIDPSGSTPGRPNSVSAIYKDITILSMTTTPPSPDWGERVMIRISVINTGFGPVDSVVVDLYESVDLSQPGGPAEWIGATDVIPLDENETTSVDIAWDNPPPGIHRLIGRVRQDGDSLNNIAAHVFTVRHTRPLIIISEYLASPTASGPGEWVEISNQGGLPVSLVSTRIGDSTDTAALPPTVGRIMPGQFLVLCESAEAFNLCYPGLADRAVEIPHWRELNNAGDRIRLIGAGGEITDSLSYRQTYGDNHSTERLELSPVFADAHDWAESVDPLGATPGRENSVQSDRAGSFQIAVTPNPLYLAALQPARIEYRLDIGERLTLKIFDRSGRLVHTILDNTPSATGSVQWDGTDSNGAPVRPGPYVLLARSDPEGASAKLVIVVAP